MAGKTYTTARGYTVHLRPVSPFEIDEVRRSVPMPEAPVRKVPTAVPGYEEEEPLTLDNATTDAERAQVRAYQAELARATREGNLRVTDFLLTECVEFDMNNLDAWTERRRRWGLPVPDDELQLRIVYVRTEIIGSNDDIENIMTMVAQSQGASEDDLKAVRNSFRGQVRRNAHRATGDAQGQVDVQRPAPGDAGGARMGPDAEPVLQSDLAGPGHYDRDRAGRAGDGRV